MSDEPQEATLDEVYLELVGEVAFLLDTLARERNLPPVLLAAQFGSSVVATIDLNRSTTIH